MKWREIPVEVWSEVCQRDQRRCWCGKAGNDMHHILPPRTHFTKEQLVLANSAKNLHIACRKCHARAHTRRAKGLLLRWMEYKHRIEYTNKVFRVVLEEVPEEELLPLLRRNGYEELLDLPAVIPESFKP